MTFKHRCFAFACATLLASGPALAQDQASESGWSTRATLYLWASALDSTLDTDLGTVETEVSFSDLLDVLDFGAMGAIETQNGPWSLVGDVFYADLGASGDRPSGLAFDGNRATIQTAALSLYGLYQVYGDAQTRLDLGGGLRSSHIDAEVTLLPNLASRAQRSVSQEWVNPILAARLQHKLSEKWTAALFVDAGPGVSDAGPTYGVVASVGYKFAPDWTLNAGYRYLHIETDQDRGDLGLTLQGPAIGVTYSF